MDREAVGSTLLVGVSCPRSGAVDALPPILFGETSPLGWTSGSREKELGTSDHEDRSAKRRSARSFANDGVAQQYPQFMISTNLGNRVELVGV